MSFICEATIGFFARRELLRYAEERPEKMEKLLCNAERAIKVGYDPVSEYVRWPDGRIDDQCHDSNTLYQFYSADNKIGLKVEQPGPISFSDSAIFICKSQTPASMYAKLMHDGVGAKLSSFIQIDGVDIDALVPRGVTRINTTDTMDDEWLRLFYDLEGTSYLEFAREIRESIGARNAGSP